MGLFKTAAKVAVASSVHGRVQRRQQQRWANEAPPVAYTPPVAAPPVAAPPDVPASSTGPDLASQLELLKQLGELKAAGVLTQAEFETKKASILAS